MLHPAFLGPCSTQAVVRAGRGGVGWGGVGDGDHVEVPADATPNEQVWR
ncbi:hypothetical protein SAMN05660350_04016 [Geodermatophilus obscurus]|uniref:Uncharacterized protein n=1 Tax=Geodermatophilus obscurus TaxID=1861 RepID=A0A1M7UV56_9ACTN|nr:hypothetical protein SAMN05660350_04016 [Geodermatophilus obscurus]